MDQNLAGITVETAELHFKVNGAQAQLEALFARTSAQAPVPAAPAPTLNLRSAFQSGIAAMEPGCGHPQAGSAQTGGCAGMACGQANPFAMPPLGPPGMPAGGCSGRGNGDGARDAMLREIVGGNG